MAVIMEATEYAKQIKSEIANFVSENSKKVGRKPSLSIISVGNDPASATYIKGKVKDCIECGFNFETVSLENVEELEDELSKIRIMYDGLIVQLPLPDRSYEHLINEYIEPVQDMDCFTHESIGALFEGNPIYEPCTPKGIKELIKHYGYTIDGKHVCIIGRSNIVGKPLALMMLEENATVTVCHSHTKNLSEITSQADILVSAVGKPKFVTPDMVKDGAAVIDVGVNRIPDSTKKSGFRLVGDCDFDDLKEKTSFITPVPGGVGPMTIAMLMNNCVEAAIK